MESDCLTLVNLVKKGEIPLHSHGSIVMDNLDVASSFSCISFSFIPRSCNKVVDCLAQFGLSSGRNHSWHHTAPSLICYLLLKDSLI